MNAAMAGLVAVEGGRVRVSGPCAAGEIDLVGATVTSWMPRGRGEQLWLSPTTARTPGTAIRGGIPICWPWFGPHPADAAQPGHGTVRRLPWRCTGHALADDGAVEVALEPEAGPGPATHPDLAVSLRVRFGTALHAALLTRAVGRSAATFSAALHTYLRVDDVRQVRLDGLDGVPYRDKIDQGRFKVQAGPVSFTGPTDRVYQPCPPTVTLHDGARRLRIASSGAGACVVWNPWAEGAERIADMPRDSWPGFVCVEAADVFESAVTLAPGTAHLLEQAVSVE